MTDSHESWSVGGFDGPVLEDGTYSATVQTLKQKPSAFGDGESYVQWFFHPDGYDDDVFVIGSTSMAQGPTAKAMEWARRILGKSNATDMKWGKDIRKEKRPVVQWGPAELAGKRCRIVVEKYFDEDLEVDKSRVVNVLLPEDAEEQALQAAEEEYEDIPF